MWEWHVVHGGEHRLLTLPISHHLFRNEVGLSVVSGGFFSARETTDIISYSSGNNTLKMSLNVEKLTKKHSSNLSIKEQAWPAHMSAVRGSVIHWGEQEFFALDLNEIFSTPTQTHTHTHTYWAGGTHAGVNFRWERSRHLQSSGLPLFCFDPLQERHLNHCNGFIARRIDYCDCICPAPVISVCVAASHGGGGIL